MTDLWVGSDAPQIFRFAGSEVSAVADAGRPSFLALHPTAARLYAVESAEDSVAAFEIEAGALRRTGTVPSGGSGPCHVLVHPAGGWLYVANYGDGVATALELDAAGDLTGASVTLAHAGSGPHADRQEGPHAHSSWVSPGGGWLVVADLGTDQLRAYRLEDGRPVGEPALTAMPPGSGPRHAAVAGDLVHVACELSCDVVTVRWDESTGTGEVVGSSPTVTRAPRTGDTHTLSHLELLDEDTLVVGVRGADQLAVVGLTDGVADRLLAEVLTVTWPRHLTVVDGAVLVAGEQADLIGVHPIVHDANGASVGEVGETVAAPAPMCLLPVR
jgi:6-phosphogluconolactonase